MSLASDEVRSSRKSSARSVRYFARDKSNVGQSSLLIGVQTGIVPASPDELFALYQGLNRDFFENELPPCSIRWSRALTRTAGNIRVESKCITLSVPLLLDVWKQDAQFEVCGVLCTSASQALVEILKHEMIHLWLHEKKLPCGHTREFRCKAKRIGQPKTRHAIARPAPKFGWIYECGSCTQKIYRRQRFGRRVACVVCCKRLSGGQYDERFRLRGQRL